MHLFFSGRLRLQKSRSTKFTSGRPSCRMAALEQLFRSGRHVDNKTARAIFGGSVLWGDFGLGTEAYDKNKDGGLDEAELMLLVTDLYAAAVEQARARGAPDRYLAHAKSVVEV